MVTGRLKVEKCGRGGWHGSQSLMHGRGWALVRDPHSAVDRVLEGRGEQLSVYAGAR